MKLIWREHDENERITNAIEINNVTNTIDFSLNQINFTIGNHYGFVGEMELERQQP